MATSSTSEHASNSEGSFFEREQARLIGQIASNFEDLLSQCNVLNRQLEQIHGVGGDFSTVAALWGRFQDLMKEQREEVQAAAEDDQGIPGTGTALAGRASVLGASGRASSVSRAAGERRRGDPTDQGGEEAVTP